MNGGSGTGIHRTRRTGGGGDTELCRTPARPAFPAGRPRAQAGAAPAPRRVRRTRSTIRTSTSGKGSPTLEQRRKRLPEYLANNRRPVNPAFVRTIFTRDHPGTADQDVVEAFAEAICALDDSIPNGTYVDMCQNLPLNDPTKLNVPVLIARGQFDGIAGFDDLLEYFRLLPHPDKQFIVMPGTAHSSLHGKNFRTSLHIFHSFWSQPEPVYEG